MFAVRSGCLGVRTPAHIGKVVRAVPLRVDGRSGVYVALRCGGRGEAVLAVFRSAALSQSAGPGHPEGRSSRRDRRNDKSRRPKVRDPHHNVLKRRTPRPTQNQSRPKSHSRHQLLRISRRAPLGSKSAIFPVWMHVCGSLRVPWRTDSCAHRQGRPRCPPESGRSIRSARCSPLRRSRRSCSCGFPVRCAVPECRSWTSRGVLFSERSSQRKSRRPKVRDPHRNVLKRRTPRPTQNQSRLKSRSRHQLLRIRMLRICKNLMRISLFDDPSAFHDRNLVCQRTYRAQIVTDE